ncbi:MAG: hypothetical protein ACI4RD_08185 [Kiritimatiellia bacterium]
MAVTTPRSEGAAGTQLAKPLGRRKPGRDRAARRSGDGGGAAGTQLAKPLGRRKPDRDRAAGQAMAAW